MRRIASGVSARRSGYAYLRGGDYAQAISDYDAAIKLFAAQASGGASAYFGRGIAHAQLGQHDLAEQDFHRALALDPGIEAAMAKIGVTR
jgi:tetratricopeptide (TPR) repeat protein